MANIKQFDRTNLIVLRKALDDAVARVGEQFGVNIQIGNCSFEDITCTFKLNCTIDDAQLAQDAARKEYDRYCYLFGLEPKHFGTTISIGGVPMTLCGLAMKRRKYPLKMRNPQGAVRLYTDVVVDRIKAVYAASTGVGRVHSTKRLGV